MKMRIVLTGGNLFVSVLVPLGIVLAQGQNKVFTDAELYILGVLLFIGLVSIELLILAERAFARDVRNTRIWDARETLDARLQEVRRLFHEVEENRVGDTTDLFVSYFNKKLVDLENSLRDASAKGEIRIDETMLEVTTWLLESSFHGGDDDIFRAIHFTSDNDFFFDVHARRYFQQVFNLVRRGSVTGVRRVAIYANQAELDDPRTSRLLTFHQETPGYEIKLLPLEDFQQVIHDYHLQNLVKDFGIYGRAYLYKGIVARDEEIVGSYSRDQLEITRFVGCFETCWQMGESPRVTRVNQPITLDWLYETDPVGRSSIGQRGPSRGRMWIRAVLRWARRTAGRRRSTR